MKKFVRKALPRTFNLWSPRTCFLFAKTRFALDMKNFVAKLFTALEGKTREPSHVLYEDLLLQKKNVSSLRKSVNIDFKHILFL